MAEGAIDRIDCSNNKVKSKLPSQLAGPNAWEVQLVVASDNHVEFDMTANAQKFCMSLQQIMTWCVC
jgi:hypothetical protein